MRKHRLSLSKAGCRNLKDICREFDRCSRSYPALYHQRMVPWSEKGRGGISLPQWEAFRQAASAQLDDDVWSHWDEPSAEDDYLCLWSGDGEGLAEFVDLSESVAMVLSRENVDFDPFNWSCEIQQGSDWLPLLHDCAFKHQMPLLRSEMGLWGCDEYDLEDFYELAEMWDTLDDGTKIPRHPVVWRLIDNVFTSSMTAIRAMLWPDSVIATYEPWPVMRGEFTSPVPVIVTEELGVHEECPSSDTSRHQLIEEELFWSVRCAETGQHFRFETKIGFEYIAMLLRSSGIRVNPVDAYAMHGRKVQRVGAAATRFGKEQRNEANFLLDSSNSLGRNHSVIDLEADREIRDEYQRLMDELTRVGHPSHEDAEEVHKLDKELEMFKKMFIADHDENGKIRLFPKSDWEKPRKAISNAIDRTLRDIRTKSQELAEQLHSQIDRTHGFCFRPNPRLPKWLVTEQRSQN